MLSRPITLCSNTFEYRTYYTSYRISARTSYLPSGDSCSAGRSREKKSRCFSGVPLETCGARLYYVRSVFFSTAVVFFHGRAGTDGGPGPGKAGNQGVREDDQLLEWAENLAADADWSRASARTRVRTHAHT